MAVTAENISTTPIGGVSPEHVVGIWPKVAPILDRVVSVEQGFSLDHVLTELQLAHWQLWIVGDFAGAIVTQVQSRPAERVLWVQYMAGEDWDSWLDDWVNFQDELAEHFGCTSIEFQSPRKGWQRINKRFPEFKTEYAIYRKELG